MTKNISEEELLLRKRARRRLVGAIVLVIISVIVLPIIFDEPKSENEKHEIAINLPASNKNDFVLLPKEELIGRESFGDKIGSSPELQDQTKANRQNIEEIAEILNERKRIPIPGIKPKIDSPPPVEARNTNNANITNTAKGFVVQLGAFSDPMKAKQQHANLISNGFKAYTEILRVDTNEVTRVRIGPFLTRSSAEDELRKLKKLGLDGVVTPR